MTQEIDVSLVNVTKKFGDLVAVDNVSFDVPKGSFFSILGPSWSGKTTILRMIAGFEVPTSGDIFIGEKRVNDVPPNKRPCNMVFQRLALFPMMNVLDNVMFGLRRRGGMSKKEMEELANNALERMVIYQLQMLK
jgi:spermidine/putrescine transport system ATP-binding protein